MVQYIHLITTGSRCQHWPRKIANFYSQGLRRLHWFNSPNLQDNLNLASFCGINEKCTMWKFIIHVVHDFGSSLQPDVGRGFLQVSNVFLWNFARSMAVILPCSVQNCKTIWQMAISYGSTKFNEIWVDNVITVIAGALNVSITDRYSTKDIIISSATEYLISHVVSEVGSNLIWNVKQCVLTLYSTLCLMMA